MKISRELHVQYKDYPSCVIVRRLLQSTAGKPGCSMVGLWLKYKHRCAISWKGDIIEGDFSYSHTPNMLINRLLKFYLPSF